jgi:hypothetical protein
MMNFLDITIESFKEATAIYYHFWWLFTPLAIWPIFELAWINYLQERYFRQIKWDLIEVIIPKEIEKRPKNMEEFYSAVYSTYDVMIDTLYDIYLKGILDTWFSFEIVSIEGDIHFYIRTPSVSRKYIESQIYAQYSDAEIRDVEDYVLNVPNDIPSKDYELWGTDMILAREDSYPIRTYKEFEDVAAGEFVDPMSNIIEGVNKLEKGEQIWIQFLVRPTNDQWKDEANALILELIGRTKKKKSSNPLQFLIDEFIDIGRYIVFGFFNTVNPAEKGEEKKEKESLSMMLHLSPAEKDIVTAIGESTKKPGFEVDARWIYVAKREVFNKAKGNNIVFSYFSQFGSKDRNSFVPDSTTKTSAYYFFTDWRKAIRKRSILRKYKRREFDKKGYVLNTEELATIYHFPTIEVKAPTVSRVEAKKGKPPAELPI